MTLALGEEVVIGTRRGECIPSLLLTRQSRYS
jgi:hypothetical protein